MTKPTNTITNPLISVGNIYKAKVRLNPIVTHTPLMSNLNFSAIYDCNLSFKREDLQVVRSYKIRGAYNKIATADKTQLAKGVVCASAGNHAQGVAYAAQKLGVKAKIYMPSTTPLQKVKKVKFFGKDFVEIVLTGDTFDDAFAEAMKDAIANQLLFVHPFDDEKVIEGQATVGLEIIEDSQSPIDYIFVGIGGGGLAAGLGSYFKQVSPDTKIIGVEPAGAAAMQQSLAKGKNTPLHKIDNFVDGAAVKKVGDLTFSICQNILDDILLVPEGKVCSTILKLYNEEGIIAEPAGALTIAALEQYKDKIKGKNVVCVISGGNNDITRTEEIKERSLLYEGLKHYFIIRFPQRAGALREFLNVLGPNDDIAYFEYTKKHSREMGPAIVGIELQNQSDYAPLLKRMETQGIKFQYLNSNSMLFDILV